MSKQDLNALSRRGDIEMVLARRSSATVRDNAGSARFAPEFLVDQAVEREAEGARERVFAEIATLRLERNVAEIEADGVTVLRPEQVSGRDFIERLRDTILRI